MPTLLDLPSSVRNIQLLCPFSHQRVLINYGTPGNEVLRNFCTPSPDGPRPDSWNSWTVKQLKVYLLKIFHLHGALSCLVLETKHKGIVTHLIILWNPVFQHDSFFKVSARCFSVLYLLKKQEMYIINSSTSMTALNPKFYKLHSHLKNKLLILWRKHCSI